MLIAVCYSSPPAHRWCPAASSSHVAAAPSGPWAPRRRPSGSEGPPGGTRSSGAPFRSTPVTQWPEAAGQGAKVSVHQPPDKAYVNVASCWPRCTRNQSGCAWCRPYGQPGAQLTVRLPFSLTMTPATDSAAVTSVVVNSTTVGDTWKGRGSHDMGLWKTLWCGAQGHALHCLLLPAPLAAWIAGSQSGMCDPRRGAPPRCPGSPPAAAAPPVRGARGGCAARRARCRPGRGRPGSAAASTSWRRSTQPRQAWCGHPCWPRWAPKINGIVQWGWLHATRCWHNSLNKKCDCSRRISTARPPPPALPTPVARDCQTRIQRFALIAAPTPIPQACCSSIPAEHSPRLARWWWTRWARRPHPPRGGLQRQWPTVSLPLRGRGSCHALTPRPSPLACQRCGHILCTQG